MTQSHRMTLIYMYESAVHIYGFLHPSACFSSTSSEIVRIVRFRGPRLASPRRRDRLPRPSFNSIIHRSGSRRQAALRDRGCYEPYGGSTYNTTTCVGAHEMLKCTSWTTLDWMTFFSVHNATICWQAIILQVPGNVTKNVSWIKSWIRLSKRHACSKVSAE